MLLKHWKKQLEWDMQHRNEIEFSQEEWNLVQEGLADYKNGDVLSLEEFINKREELNTKDFAEKVMEGLNLAVKKVIEDAAKNNESIVVSINGKIEHIFPKMGS